MLTSNDLDSFRLVDAPATLYLIRDFITSEEASQTLYQIYKQPTHKWRQLLHRRLQHWGGRPPSTFQERMIVEPLPDWLQSQVEQLKNLNIWDKNEAPNHCLVNEYLPSQGIIAHHDGPIYAPKVATISLGSDALIHFSAENREPFTVYLPEKSLFIVTEECYTVYRHGIASEQEEFVPMSQIVNLERIPKDRISVSDNNISFQRFKTRISLTWRRVLLTRNLSATFSSRLFMKKQ